MSTPLTPEQADRFWAKVEPTGVCWEWRGATTRGYGRFYAAGVGTSIAHRIAYRLLVGPIPDGLVLDHLCRNRGCVNPDHLEPVTNEENIRRGFQLRGSASGRWKDTCVNGHDSARERRRKAGSNQAFCGACRREQNAARRARHRAANAAT